MLGWSPVNSCFVNWAETGVPRRGGQKAGPKWSRQHGSSSSSSNNNNNNHRACDVMRCVAMRRALANRGRRRVGGNVHRFLLCIYIYMYTYMYVYTYVYIYIYI